MKSLQLFFIVVLGFGCAHFVLANGNGYGTGSNGTQTTNQQATNQAGQCIAVTSAVTPTEAEITSLNFMREEEKLAHDLYRVLAAQWQLPIFSNIADSEATHFTQVQCLLDAYQRPNPAAEQAGVFNNVELQALYDDLIARGSVSMIEALQVGALVEEVDILDLTDALAIIQVPEIKTIYENLRKGSENHLRAFVRQLAQNGEAYNAQVLPSETLTHILAGGTMSSMPVVPVAATFNFDNLTLTLPEVHIQSADGASPQAYRLVLHLDAVQAYFSLLELTPIPANHATALFDVSTTMLTIPALQIVPASVLFPSEARFSVALTLTNDGLAFEMVNIAQLEQE